MVESTTRVTYPASSANAITSKPLVTMQILVAIKEVEKVTKEFEIEGTAVADQFIEHNLNEWDEYALEEAVRLEEDGIADEVVTVTIGPNRAEETIRTAFAKGADRAIRVWDELFEPYDLLDSRTAARVFSAVVRQENPDLVLTGVQASDDGFGATGVTLANQIDFGWAALVTDVEIDGESVYVRRELEGGFEERVRVDLPAVLTIQSGINEPRYASLRGIRQAQSKKIDVRSMTDLGLDKGVATGIDIQRMYEPEAESETTYIEGEPSETATGLLAVLAEEGVIEQ